MSGGFDFSIHRSENIALEKIPPIIDEKIMNEFVIIFSNIQREILEEESMVKQFFSNKNESTSRIAGYKAVVHNSIIVGRYC